MGWFMPALLSSMQVINRERIDIIYSTGRPWTSHVIGMALKLLTGKPLVAEFRDPWITNPFREKYSVLKNKFERYLERKVIEKADLVISNTYELKGEFIKRFQRKSQEKFITILNSFDPDDYPHYSTEEPIGRKRDKFTITHTGFLYGRRDPINFLKAIKFLLDNKLVDINKIKVYLIGSIELSYNVDKYICSNNMNSIIITKGHVPYEKSLLYLQQSDVLLLLQPGTTTQIPSKLFDYIGMRKPILAISPCGGATYNMIVKECIGQVAQPDDVQEIADVIYKMYTEWAEDFCANSSHENAYHKFNVKNITKDLSVELSKLVK
jgi:glycosyltransferase involved in cell wall biosynthesis